MLNLENKTAVITGGGSGIGKAIALLFAKQGATVHIVEVNDVSASSVVKEITTNGQKAYSHVCDISNQQQVIEVVNKIGRVDILVNNAGIAHVGNVENTASADFEKVFNVNVKGAYNCLFAVIPAMKLQGSGVILNLCSIAAWVGIPDRFAYSMSKGAIHAMTISIAKDYLTNNIRCNCISPARVHTPFVDGFLTKNYPGKEEEMFTNLSKTQPIGRMGTPDEIATLALYLCSEESSFITGNNYNIDGGFITLNN